MKQLILNIRPDAPPSFHNYLPGDNIEAAAALYLAAGGAPGEAVLYCWGEAGCGRTHLLRACVAWAVESGRHALYGRGSSALPEDLPDLLAVDDVEGLDEAGQVALFSLINQAKMAQKTVVVAGSVAPAQLNLRRDLTTRLGSGLVFWLHVLNDEQRAQAVRERAAAHGLLLSEDVLRYVLHHARRDLPSLLMLIDRLDELSLSHKCPLTLPRVRAWLAQA